MIGVIGGNRAIGESSPCKEAWASLIEIGFCFGPP